MTSDPGFFSGFLMMLAVGAVLTVLPYVIIAAVGLVLVAALALIGIVGYQVWRVLRQTTALLMSFVSDRSESTQDTRRLFQKS